jgi:AcrR family transcriptional regulator
MARSLGVTKGSFYWHFGALGELAAGALRRWEEIDGETLAEAGEIAEPRARLVAVFEQAMEARLAQALFVTLSASGDPAVAEALRRISGRRLQFLETAYRELGLGRKEAREQALLAYSAFVGALHLRQRGAPGLRTRRDLAAYIRQAVKALIPAPAGRRKRAGARQGDQGRRPGTPRREGR